MYSNNDALERGDSEYFNLIRQVNPNPTKMFSQNDALLVGYLLYRNKIIGTAFLYLKIYQGVYILWSLFGRQARTNFWYLEFSDQ